MVLLSAKNFFTISLPRVYSSIYHIYIYIYADIAGLWYYFSKGITQKWNERNTEKGNKVITKTHKGQKRVTVKLNCANIK